MKLRAHHLLCIQKFTGHGYDAAFTAHMTAVCTQLRRSPESPVLLTDGCDTLCSACPHRVGSFCDSAEKVSALDAAVCKACGIQTGAVCSWERLRELSRTRVLQSKLFHAICCGCQWYALCRHVEVSDGNENCSDT